MSMFVLMLGASLTFGVAVFTAAMYSEGALLALRSAAYIIGWLCVLATAVGFLGLRHAGVVRVSAAALTLCAGAAALSMAHFLEWNEPAPVPIRLAKAETVQARPVIEVASFRAPAPAAVVRPTAHAASACTTLRGVESLQCNRCSEKLGVARVTCHESVRLRYCETELGDERTCPSPFPQSYPG